MKKRLLAFLCVLSMVFSLVPATAFAEELTDDTVEAVAITEETESVQYAAATITDKPDIKRVTFACSYLPGACELQVDYQIYKDGQFITSKSLVDYDIYDIHCQMDIWYTDISYSLYAAKSFDDIQDGNYVMKTNYRLYAPGKVLLTEAAGPDFNFTLNKVGYCFGEYYDKVIRDEVGFGRSFLAGHEVIQRIVRINGQEVPYDDGVYYIDNIVSSDPGVITVEKFEGDYDCPSYYYETKKAGTASLIFETTFWGEKVFVTIPVEVIASTPEPPVVTPPGKPTISSLTNTSTGITIKWGKVSSAKGYYIYRSTNDGTYKKIKTFTSNSTVSYTDTVAKVNGYKYKYKVYSYKTVSGTTYKTASSVKTKYYLTRPTISSLTNIATRKMVVKWGKNSKASGYKIQYSTSSTFASGNKIVTVKSPSTVSKTISSLTKGKKYYVRVRSYKLVSGVYHYSAYSTKKYVKINK